MVALSEAGKGEGWRRIFGSEKKRVVSRVLWRERVMVKVVGESGTHGDR